MPRPSPVIDVQLMRRPVKYAPIEPFPHGAGGECVFLGLTRAEVSPQHGRLLRLCYEAYEPMAEAMLGDLAREAAALFDCMLVRMHQALGDVALGEASVLVQIACANRGAAFDACRLGVEGWEGCEASLLLQIACAHRGAAFDACRFGIDSLKRLAPIWKREIWEDGTSW